MSAPTFAPSHIIGKGWGFDVGQDFARAAADLPCMLAPGEYARGGCAIAYILPDPASRLGFLRFGAGCGPRAGLVRVHVPERALSPIPTQSA